MAITVTAASGYDLEYALKGLGRSEGEKTAGGYYINAAQQGEAPGRWAGRGAEALGFSAGQVVDPEPYKQVFRQIDPRTGEKLGRAPGKYPRFSEHEARLKAAEPYATAERLKELERMAAQQTRKSPRYTDMTVSVSKSISVFHASIRENARQARLAGDERAAAYWEQAQARYQQIVQEANAAGVDYLQEQAGYTRTGHHGTRVDGQEPGRYESAGLVVASWLQGTSRDGDPQDHVHNQIARMTRTDADGKWRALDRRSMQNALPGVGAVVAARLEAALSREFGVQWVPRVDSAERPGPGNEIKGVTRETMEKYSTRTKTITDRAKDMAAEFTDKHGREPNAREMLFIQQEATMSTRDRKPEGVIDWDALTAKWDVTLGGELARVAGDISDLAGPREDGAPAKARDPVPALVIDRAAQTRVMATALARVQEMSATWSRADLLRATGLAMPVESRAMDPRELDALTRDLAARALSGAVEQVIALTAPDYPAPPPSARRELDGRSVYVRPGSERFATAVQLSKEQRLLDAARREGAPALERDASARALGADPETLATQLEVRAEESRGVTGSGLRLDQAAALHHALTSPRTADVITGPAGTGKTHTLAQAARMWPGPVMGITPSQASRNVLAKAGVPNVRNFAQFLGHLPGERGARGAQPVAPGSLILIDEGSMLSTSDMADIVSLAARSGSKVIVAGDQEQIAAVEDGGGMALLADQMGHTQLAVPVRFTAQWEQEASLRLRAGDASVLTVYDQQGRIRGAGLEKTMAQVRRDYVAHYLAGHDVLLMARSDAMCQKLSREIRDDLIHLGKVDAGREVTLAEDAKASAGDLIVAGRNDHRLEAGVPGRTLANGDTLMVDSVRDGHVMARLLLDADPETGAQRLGEAFAYRDLGNARLAYAVTGHSSLGRTVHTGLAVFNGTESRQWGYVALSRGTDANNAYPVTAPREADLTEGTRPAPELARSALVKAERAGEAAAAADNRREALGVLSDVIEHDGAEVSATVQMQRSLANADHLGLLHVIWQGETRDARDASYEKALREVLPEPYASGELSSKAEWLYRTLRSAEAAGKDPREVLGRAVAERSLHGSADVAAVLDARIREREGHLAPLGEQQPWAQQVPDLPDPTRQDYARRVGEAMDARKTRIGEHAAVAQPVWAMRALGPVPEDAAERAGWEKRASSVGAYREMFGYASPAEPIGPEPVNSPEARAAWHEALGALGPADGVDLRAKSDGQLHVLRDNYERQTAWAPQHVGNALRQVRLGADDASLDATRRDAEAAVALERAEKERAALHQAAAVSSRAAELTYREHEAKLAKTQAAREEWERETERDRSQAIAADTELRRRDPERGLAPLRSAEPEGPTEEQRAELEPEGGDYEPPSWLTEAADRARSARETIDERRSEREPDEDHEWGDRGQAWPEEARRERDAILQPPRQEMTPAPEVTAASQARHESEPDTRPEPPDRDNDAPEPYADPEPSDPEAGE